MTAGWRTTARTAAEQIPGTGARRSPCAGGEIGGNPPLLARYGGVSSFRHRAVVDQEHDVQQGDQDHGSEGRT